MTTDTLPAAEVVRLALLVDVRDGLVANDPAGCPYLRLPDGSRARVAGLVQALERAGLVHRVAGSLRWWPTGAGEALLEESGC